MGYRIGVDVGEKSVGFAAVEYDAEGMPTRVLSAVAHLHDGGMDPDTAKSPLSRLATAGVARRTRRLVRNRRRRLVRLDRLLNEMGYATPRREVPQTYEAWHARARLVSGFVADEDERNALLVLSIRHIARHRGWRNPWFKFTRLAASESPTQGLLDIITRTRTTYLVDLQDDATLGQVVSAVIGQYITVRPTKRALANPEPGPVISTQVRQEDSLAELRRILSTQRVDEASAAAIYESVFFQNAPTIPKDRIGRCALLPDEMRASVSALEFQEYRIRSTVANLRIGRGSHARMLVEEEHDLVVEKLLGWRQPDKPRWRDVAEWLGVPQRDLPIPTIDDSGLTVAPVDRTSTFIEKRFSARTDVGAWWRTADAADRAELIEIVTDLSGQDTDLARPSVAALLDTLTDESQENLDKLELDPGRAAYSCEALRRLNDVMRRERCDLHDARKAAFDVADDWAPPRPTFDDPIEHPTVARVNVLVRRFLSTATLKWGLPDEVVVEHVRSAFMGPAALAVHSRTVTSNRRRRDQTKALLVEQGVERPSDTDVRRYECVERQNCVCLYCGGTITMTTSELDHIVARAAGGSGRRDNLVAVCRGCNADKGRQAFAAFAERTNRAGVSLDEAQERVRNWQRGAMSVRQFAVLKRDVGVRLALTDDEELDERSMESTAYAAREMRFRIESFLAAEASRLGLDSTPQVSVYQGLITSEARKAGGVDDLLQLRVGTRKSRLVADVLDPSKLQPRIDTPKLRLDRRHHAIDAAVLTILRPAIAKTLTERNAIHRDNRDNGSHPEWREYQGRYPADQETFRAWQISIRQLADVLRAEVEADRVAVVRPLRLAPRAGSLHADTVGPLDKKAITDAFTADDIRRICDQALFSQLTTELAGQNQLPEDDQRGNRLGWNTEKPVMLFPSNAPYIQVRGGAAALGDTCHYARIYAWRANAGFRFGMVRLFTGELATIGLSGRGIDIFTHELPLDSQAMRVAPPNLVKRIIEGEARQIGWITLGDEIELDPTHFSDGETTIAQFMREAPERRWTLKGFPEPSRLRITPSLLASEGLSDSTPEIVRTVLENSGSVMPTVNVVLGSPGCTIIRRTVLGRPRWKSDGLPVSWNVGDAADQAF